MIIKTKELTGPALDWAVAKCEGRPWPDNAAIFLGDQHYRPSTDWAHGGPLIEQDKLVVSPDPGRGWYARSFADAVEFYGRTPLIAAMRCLVASRLGEEIDVPDDLYRAETNVDVLKDASPIKVYELTLVGFDGATDETDHLILNVMTRGPSSLEDFTREMGDKIKCSELLGTFASKDELRYDIDFTLPEESAALAERVVELTRPVSAINDDVLAGFKTEFEVFKEGNAILIADLHLEMKGRANALSEFLFDQVGELKSKLGSDAANAAGDDKGAQERAIEDAEAWVADNVSCQVREEIAAVLWLNGAEEGAELIRANISKLLKGVRP